MLNLSSQRYANPHLPRDLGVQTLQVVMLDAAEPTMHSPTMARPLPSFLSLKIMLSLGLLMGALTQISSVHAARLSSPATKQAPSEFIKVRSSSDHQAHSLDGKVEAVRQTMITAQIAGAITHLTVQAGDAVKAGQLLVKLDARAAQQQVQAGQAQVAAAQAELAVAKKEFDRQSLLHAKNFISSAQLDRAQAQFLAAQAQARAQIAQAGVQQTQSGFYSLHAPFDGIVASMPSALGDMALPGKSLMTIVDPKQLRVSVAVPQQLWASWKQEGAKLELSFPGVAKSWRIPVAQWTVLPTIDASSYTVQIRYDIKHSGHTDVAQDVAHNLMQTLKPGMFARVQYVSDAISSKVNKQSNALAQRLYVPQQAILKRADLDAVYVQTPSGHVLLRQVRLGPLLGHEREILSGVSAGEKVALDPIKAGAYIATPSAAQK
jgi:RND family efflux transporter MFP subunit